MISMITHHNNLPRDRRKTKHPSPELKQKTVEEQLLCLETKKLKVNGNRVKKTVFRIYLEKKMTSEMMGDSPCVFFMQSSPSLKLVMEQGATFCPATRTKHDSRRKISCLTYHGFGSLNSGAKDNIHHHFCPYI